MSSLQRAFVAGLGLLVLAACTTPDRPGYTLRENLREMDGMQLDSVAGMGEPQALFLQGLYNGYLELSGSELGEGDLEDSDSFALRAQAAAEGKLFEPEHMYERKIPEDKYAEMQDARSRLTALLRRTARVKAPLPAARAQVMFDCWMQEQEENYQPDDIEACRNAFYEALAEVEAAMPPEPAPAPAPAVVPPAAPETFVVFFAFDSAVVGPEGQRIIDRAIRVSRETGLDEFSVTGHADRAGSEEYNVRLSLRRADAVRNILVRNGIDAGKISVAGRGESEPAVPTPDGQREPANRRVEIILQ